MMTDGCGMVSASVGREIRGQVARQVVKVMVMMGDMSDDEMEDDDDRRSR